MHFPSAAEARVAVHIIYQPNFVEGLENRPCATIPGIAILDGHPLLAGKALPYSSGTVEIARALGISHPTTCDDRTAEEIQREGKQKDYFPFVSDFLSLLGEGNGVRGINVYVKKRKADLHLDPRKQDLLLIERTLYAESRIPTVQIAEEDLDKQVTNNLVRLAKIARRPEDVTNDQFAQALLYMEERIFHSAPNTWETYLRENLGLLPRAVFRIFHYGVFHRHLKVDLKEAVAMDRIHRREKTNYAAEFAARFLEPMP